ncbi:Uncharacterized protein, chloroplastic [Vitis vinifera]|uniref:Uncharacterized protein, chloroplastic n=1 Tax=Vitis vinifera TaxID=29760 RepID=A0A438JZM4_VITVI|nr:Uncharacterized protein, chloroplastic [Vitis vinifera]
MQILFFCWLYSFLTQVSQEYLRGDFSGGCLVFMNNWFGVRSSYAEAGVKGDSKSATIDVEADVKSERVVVLGGNGFVGSAICKAAVSKGIEVTSLSRSGRPSQSSSWVDQVNWVTGMF